MITARVLAAHSELLVAAFVLVGALVALVLARLMRSWRGSRRAVRRAARAGAGEVDAVDLLEEAGFRIVATQARTWWSPLVDGEPHETELRADFLVEGENSDGVTELLVAEVKTGEEAPDLSTAATRRQLLEYQVAFSIALGTTGVLLVCPERGTIHRVEFPSAPQTAANVPREQSRASLQSN
ncbi:MAG TPA: hypothetical protein VGM90_10030 [Kofleriaceae bacterium]|jgi:hypothetical protein